MIPAKLRALSVAPGSRRGRRFPLPANCFPGHSGQRRRGPAATWGGGSKGRQGGGSYTGPRGRAPSCARPGKWPGPGAAGDQRKARKGKEGKSGKEREGKGKAKQDQAAFRQPGLERTASGENQNTPSYFPSPVTPAQPHIATCCHGEAALIRGVGLKSRKENWCPRRTSSCLLPMAAINCDQAVAKGI